VLLAGKRVLIYQASEGKVVIIRLWGDTSRH
jgi:hypothetical protein